jgi:HK97 family phage prohead protease
MYGRFAFEAEIKADDQGVIEGYGSVFGNKDNGGDIVESGAFATSRRDVKMLWQHDPSQPIGVWDDWMEDAKGLRMKGRLALKTAKGAEAYELIRMGAVSGLSIGYRIKKDGAQWEGNARRLKNLDLHEVSVVTMPMNEQAKIVAVKGDAGEYDIRLFERGLRDVFGLSQSEAKAFIADGFKSLKSTRDVGEGEAFTAILQQALKEAFHDAR